MSTKSPNNNKKAKGICKIHDARFYNLSPRSINYLVYNKKSNRLAISRNRQSIEIWNMQCEAPYLEKTILGSSKLSIEALAWVGLNRLFSTGLTGELIEWDLQLLKPKRNVLMTGNSAWCLDLNGVQNWLAVGTEEGYINIFDVSNDDGIEYVKIFDKQEGRILCCKFDSTGDFLVTGSVDVIRIWDCKTGHAIYRMNCGRTEVKKETAIWTLAVLRDFTIISGDSRGRITIWDGKLGTQIDTFVVSKSDVLALTVSEDQTTFCCSGIDPLIRMYALTPVKRDNQMTNQWIKFIQRNIHDHDVLALASIGNKIISGGIDGYIGISYTKKSMSSFTKYGPFLQQPCAIVADDNNQRLLLLKYFNYLELWQLGVPSSDNLELIDDDINYEEYGDDAEIIGRKSQNMNCIGGRTYLSLEKGVRKILEFRSCNDEPIVCCSISRNGRWLMYSTETSIRLFRVGGAIEDGAQLTLERIKTILPTQFTACTKMLFSYDSKAIFLGKLNQEIDIFQINDERNEIDYKETVILTKFIKDSIHLMVLSKCSTYLICAGVCCNISIWKNIKKKNKKAIWEHYQSLPKYIVPPTAIAIHPNTPKLVAAFPDMKIFEYDLEELKFTCSTTNKLLVPNLNTHPIQNIVLDPRNENIMILHNDGYLFVLEKIQKQQRGAKVMRQADDDDNDDDQSKLNDVLDLKLKYKCEYEHFVHLSWLADNELVTVGVNPLSLIAQLPPSLKQKKFGVM